MENRKKLQRRIVDRIHKTPNPGMLVLIAEHLGVRWDDLYEVYEKDDLIFYEPKPLDLDFETNKE